MAIDERIYDPNLRAGGRIFGASTTPGQYYSVIAVPNFGTTAGNVFPIGTTAPCSGTITGFWTVSTDTTASTVTLFVTTAGTVVSLFKGTSAGLATWGTTVYNASFTAGDVFTVTGTGNGSCIGYVTIQV